MYGPANQLQARCITCKSVDLSPRETSPHEDVLGVCSRLLDRARQQFRNQAEARISTAATFPSDSSLPKEELDLFSRCVCGHGSHLLPPVASNMGNAGGTKSRNLSLRSSGFSLYAVSFWVPFLVPCSVLPPTPKKHRQCTIAATTRTTTRRQQPEPE
jgi:hypothetical protein